MKIRIKKTPITKAQFGLNIPSKLAVPNFNSILTPPDFNQMNNDYAQRANQMVQPSFDYDKGLSNITGASKLDQPAFSLNYEPQGLPQSFVTPDMKMRAGADMYASDFNSFEDWEAKGSPALSTMPQMTPGKVDNRSTKYINPFDAAKGIIGIGSMMTDYFTDQRKQKDFKKQMVLNQMSDGLFSPQQGSRGDYVATGTSWGMFKPDQYVVNKGMYTAEMGGENPDTMNKIRIRITGGPSKMAYGGQTNYGLDLGRRQIIDDRKPSYNESVKNTIDEVPREYANIEAEKGETLYYIGDDGPVHMKIGGKRHYEGGTPLNVPEGSFIFSDTNKMKIKDPKILAEFGKSYKKGGITPAQIAKQYDLNKYRAILEDPNSDETTKSTAQLMVKNYQKKLGKLSMVQEGMKNFPQGIPQVALKPMSEEQDSLEDAAYGGYMLPKAQYGIPGNFGIPAWSTMPNTEPFIYGPGTGIVPVSSSKSNKRTIVVQNKDPKKPPVAISEEDIFDSNLIAELKNKGYDIKFSPRIGKGDVKVPILQHKQKSGLYGDVQMDEIEELKSRHPWYFANKPNWNPSNPADVLDFQTRYDEEFAKQKGYSYFDGKRPFSKKDKMLGEYTYNAPNLDMNLNPNPDVVTKFRCTPQGVVEFPVDPNDPTIVTGLSTGIYDTEPEAQAACAQKKTPPTKKKPDDVDPGKNEFEGNDPLPFGYMAPDVFNMFAAAAYPPKKNLPYMAPIDLQTAEPTFFDPNRELAANTEQANIQSQYLATMGNPQAYLANTAALQGRAAENAANVLSKYNNLNVGVANDYAFRNSEVENKERLLNAERANELYKGNVIANEQYRNAQRQFLNNFGKAYSNAWNNRMNLGMLNAVNRSFNIDPRTGRSYFKGGYGTDKFGAFSPKTTSDDDYWKSVNDGYLKAKAQFPELTPTEYLRRIGQTNTSYDKDGDGIMDATRFVRTMSAGGAYGAPMIYPF